MKITIELDNGDQIVTSPERLQLAPGNDGKSVYLVALNQPIAVFSGQLIAVEPPVLVVSTPAAPAAEKPAKKSKPAATAVA
jgi:hypothetical protein